MNAARDDTRDDEGPVAVTRSVSLDLDPDAAWRLIGTAEGLGTWLGRDVAVDVVPGGGLRVHDDDGTRSGAVTDVQPGRSLSFRWADGEVASDVTIAVTADEDGRSRVIITETRAGAGHRALACADAGAAWDSRLLALELGALVAVPAFAALADPTRRTVLRAVAEGREVTATDLGIAVGVSRQAVAKHLDVLAAAGLVADMKVGRERRWHVTPSPLSDAATWLDRTGAAWDARLARLAAAPPPPDP